MVELVVRAGSGARRPDRNLERGGPWPLKTLHHTERTRNGIECSFRREGNSDMMRNVTPSAVSQTREDKHSDFVSMRRPAQSDCRAESSMAAARGRGRERGASV